MSISNDLRIPDKVYVKFQRRSRDDEEYLIGFMTPYDSDDPEFEGRKVTVDRWSSHRSKNFLVDRQAWVGYNEPIQGFEILHTVSRYRTSNKVWRILDPRGFELEISSWNLSQMLKEITIVNGVIQDECVWCRNRTGDNWLVSVESDQYKDAKKYTKIRNTRISLRDVNRGDIITLHDGSTVKYLGGLYYPETKGRWRNENPYIKVRRKYFYLCPDEDGNFTVLSNKSSIKVGDLVEEAKKPLTKKQTEELAATASRSRSLGRYRGSLMFMSTSKVEEDELEIILEDYDFPDDFLSSPEDYPVLVADISSGLSTGEGFYVYKGLANEDGSTYDREGATQYYRLGKLDADKFKEQFVESPIQ